MNYTADGQSDYLLVGIIGKARGLKGHVRVRPYTDDPDRFFDLERVFLSDGNAYTPVDVAEAEVNGDAVHLRFEGVTDRTAAELLTGKPIYIKREDAVELPQGAYFITDLIGCRVEDETGEFIGSLAEVMQAGSVDVYMVKGGPTGDVMFPALKFIITSTDIQAKKITIDSKRLIEVAVFEG